MTVKNYVLDTNVLLHDARAIHAFADNNVVIPIYVIEEVDTFKKDQSELGRNARQVARLLDEVRHSGSLATGQPLSTGGTVRVALSKNPPKNPSYDSRSMDQRILELALEVRDADPKTPTIMVTKDVNMRVRGDALGLDTADFEPAARSRKSWRTALLSTCAYCAASTRIEAETLAMLPHFIQMA